MGNKRNRRSKRLETLSLEREVETTQVESPNTGYITLTNVASGSQGNICESITE